MLSAVSKLLFLQNVSFCETFASVLYGGDTTCIVVCSKQLIECWHPFCLAAKNSKSSMHLLSNYKACSDPKYLLFHWVSIRQVHLTVLDIHSD